MKVDLSGKKDKFVIEKKFSDDELKSVIIKVDKYDRIIYEAVRETFFGEGTYKVEGEICDFKLYRYLNGDLPLKKIEERMNYFFRYPNDIISHSLREKKKINKLNKLTYFLKVLNGIGVWVFGLFVPIITYGFIVTEYDIDLWGIVMLIMYVGAFSLSAYFNKRIDDFLNLIRSYHKEASRKDFGLKQFG